MNAIAITPVGRFKTLLKREFWENRGGFLWAPLIAGAIVSVLFLVGALAGSITAHQQGLRSDLVIDDTSLHGDKLHAAIGGIGDGMLMAGMVLSAVVLAFVVFFYALGSLYDDRRDRSVLFWKSMPLSDTETVLSKLAWAVLLAPLVAIAVGVVVGLVLWIITALTLTVNGLPASFAVFTHSHPLRVIGYLLGMLPVYLLWSLPTVGWLMLCSAWARSKPFLWAVLVPVLAAVTISLLTGILSLRINLEVVWYLVYRLLLSVVMGSWFPAARSFDDHVELKGPEDLSNVLDLGRGMHALATPDLWIGAAIGVAMIVLAIRLRRWRDEG
jgi:ABC-2 type transport system permease protein